MWHAKEHVMVVAGKIQGDEYDIRRGLPVLAEAQEPFEAIKGSLMGLNGRLQFPWCASHELSSPRNGVWSGLSGTE